MNPRQKEYILKNIGKKPVKAIAEDLRLTEKSVKKFLDHHRPSGTKDIPVFCGQTDKNRSAQLLFPALCLIVIVCAAYGAGLSNGFVWDDSHLVKNNTHIESFEHLGRIFTEENTYTLGVRTGYYRPLSALSYMIDYSLWRKNPAGYHLTNIVIHIASTLLVFGLYLLLIGGKWKCFFIAGLFSAHPAFVPIVGYISGRADLLGLFFSLLAVYGILKYLIYNGRTTALWAGIMCYILAVLSKEYYLITPCFIFLYVVVCRDRIKIDAPSRYALIMLAAAAIFYMLIRSLLFGGQQKIEGLLEQSFAERAFVFPYVLMQYIFTIICPVNLGMEKTITFESLSNPVYLYAFIVPLLIALAFYYAYKTKRPEWLFFLGWFIVGIIPVSNLVIPLKVFWAEHWAYTAAIGLLAFIVISVDASALRLKFPKAAVSAAGISVIAAFTLLSVKENHFWKDDETLFTRIVTKNPQSSRALSNLGSVYAKKEDYRKAIEFYTAAIERSSGEEASYYNARGTMYQKTKELKKAMADFEKAVILKPSNAMFHNNLGSLYATLGMMDKARAEWQEAIRINPDYELARKNLEIGGTGR